jgi:peptidoglycan/LPS O-acetylase OafA/YrhL
VWLVWTLRDQFIYSLSASAPGSPAVECGIATAHTCVIIRVLEMLLGSMLAVLVNDRGRGAVRAMRFVSRTPVILGCAAAIVFAVQCGGRDDKARYLLSHGLLLPLLAVLVAGLWQNKGIVNRALGWDFLQRAGKASLLIYFLHVPVMELVRGFGDSVWSRSAAARGPVMFLAGFATTLTLAFLLQPKYDAFSDRLSGWLRRIVPQGVAEASVPAAAHAVE